MAKTERAVQSLPQRLVGWGVQLAMVLLLLLALEAFLTRAAVGVMAPPIEAMTLEQQHFSLQQFQGKPAVIHFWASWCPVCELEQGVIHSLASEVAVITVAMQSGSPAEVRDYLRQQAVAYPVVNDEHGSLAKQYGVKAVPASFIIDRGGKVRFATRGYTSGWGLRIRVWLAGLF